MKIALASGKGGTGKTTIATNLATLLARSGEAVTFLDCDVEEPNDIIFLPDAEKLSTTPIFQQIPKIDTTKCTYCRACADYCEFNAIVVIPPIKFTEVNASLCHSCGACLVACQHNAIIEQPHEIGSVSKFINSNGAVVVEGRLKVGSAMQSMLIKEVKRCVVEADDIIIYDAPPGTSCPVVETLSDTDYVILVTEPTPFGLHDLRLMVELLKDVQIPFGVVVNKAGLGDNSLYEYLLLEGIEILGELPFSRPFASAYATGSVFENIQNNISDSYKKIIGNINQRMLENEGDNYFKW